MRIGISGQRYYDADTGRFISQDSYLGELGTPPSLHRYLYAYSNPTVYIDLYGYESIFSDAADFLHGLTKDSKTYISNLNKKADKGMGDRALAAMMGIGNTLIDGVAGAANLADLTTDVTLAMNPATRGTEDGDRARRRVKETATNVTLTAKKAVEYVTTEDPAAMAQTAKEKLGNYLEKTFIEGDLNYTADFSGKAFGVALAGASVRAAQIGRAAGAADAEAATAKAAEQAAIRERVEANVAEIKDGIRKSNFGQFVANEGKVQEALNIWPPNRGRIGPVETTELPQGFMIDRYGSPRGTFVAPQGTPFAERALPSVYEHSVPKFEYEVLQPIPNAVKSRALRWFGQRGMGPQFELEKSVQWYLDNGYLRQK